MLLAGSGDGSVVVWRLDESPIFGRHAKHPANLVFRLAVAPQGDRLALIGLNADGRSLLHRFELPGLMSEATPVDLGPGRATGVFFKGSSELVVASPSGLDRWPADVGAVNPTRLIPGSHDGLSASAAMDTDRRWLAVISADDTVSLIDLISGETRWSARLPAGLTPNRRRFPAVAPGAKQVAVVADETKIVLLDGLDGHLIGAPMAGHRLATTSLLFEIGGGRLFSAGMDSEVRLWSAIDGRELGRLPRASGALLALATNGELLAAGAHDGAIELWLLADRQRLGRLSVGLERVVTAVAFTPDGQRLLAADQAGHLVSWPASTAAWRDVACAIAARPLDPSEIDEAAQARLRNWPCKAQVPG